jgi:phosphoribosylformylglycinamidine cyclo-ligase
MPGLYKKGDYDLAGFCVGVASRSHIIDGSAVTPGDAVLGLASTGLHSNGYSLARKIAFEIGGHQVGDQLEELGTTVGDALLTPTRIYVKPVRKVLNYYRVKNVVHAIAHITGGGLHENLARVIPEGVQIVIDRSRWPVPPVFTWLQRLGDVEQAEMDQVFNMGIGMVLVVASFYADSIREQLTRAGVPTWLIGRAEQGPQGVVWGEL